MAHKILIVGPAWVGDMVMAQCLFKLLKQRQPDVVIDVLAPAWSLPLLARMPEVSESLVLAAGHGQLALRERYQMGKSLRGKGYTQAIVLPNSFKSALIPFWAKIPRRTGWRGEMRYGVLNDIRTLDKKRYPLMIERFMVLGLAPEEMAAFVQQGGGSLLSERQVGDDPLSKRQVNDYPFPELQVAAEASAQALAKHQLSFPTRPVLALCPGAEFGAAKRWPAEHYAELAREKIQAGWDVWIFGSAKDAVVAERIQDLTERRCVSLAGKTNLAEAVDLLALATVVVSNDSGLMHIAAALRKPLVAVYGPTSTTFTPPLHKQAKVLKLQLECQPCFQRECPLKHHRCMRELQPQMVVDALVSL